MSFEPNASVEALPYDVHHRPFGDHIDRHAGIKAHIFGDQRRKDHPPRAQRQIQAQGTGRLGAMLIDPFHGGADRGQSGSDLPHELFSFSGQGDTACRPVEQTNTQTRFQSRHGVAQRRQRASPRLRRRIEPGNFRRDIGQREQVGSMTI